MAYTEMCMLAIMPGAGALPAIGSAVENASRTEDTSFTDFICSTPEAESVRASFGEAAYRNYVERLLDARQAEAAKSAKQMTSVRSVRPNDNSRSNSTKWLHKWIAKLKQAYKDN